MNRKPLLLAIALLVASLAGALGATGQAILARESGVEQAQTAPLVPVGAGLNYQGRLKQNGNPANGQFDFEFTLYDSLAGGNQVGAIQTILNVTVADGLFTVTLDFGAEAFQGQARWLAIAVRPAGGGSYTALSPRQALSSVPYAASLSPGAVITSSLGTPALTVSNINGTGILGVSAVADGLGVYGVANNGLGAHGVHGYSATNIGVYGQSDAATGGGVYGVANGGPSAKGVYGISSTGTGMYGDSGAYNGKAIWGEANAGPVAAGVYGSSTSGIGVWGASTGANGWGVYGFANTGTNPIAVYGDSPSGRGVYGSSQSGTGVFGESSTGAGVFGRSGAESRAGVYGETTAAFGYGVHGRADVGSLSGDWSTAVYGEATNYSGVGVYGLATVQHGIGVYGQGWSWAGYFNGSVRVVGKCCGGGAGMSTIDHPLNPADKYLSHSFVESPDMMNVYNGNVTTDAKAEAVVALPDWFEAFNKDFRYQLTIMGEQFAQARIASKIKDNRFTIKTDKPNVEVSWQVTGIRKDAFANAHRISVEEEKQGKERGKYLHPTEHGQPESKGIDYERTQKMQPEKQGEMENPNAPGR